MCLRKKMNLYNKVKSLKDEEVDFLLNNVWPGVFNFQHEVSIRLLGELFQTIKTCDVLSEFYLDEISSYLFKKRSLLTEKHKGPRNMKGSLCLILTHCINRKLNKIN